MSRRIYVWDRKRTREEWISYLIDNKILPIWRNNVRGNVVFKRLENPWGTKHAFSKKQRLKVILELDISSKEECDRLRELIKNKIGQKTQNK